MVLQPFHRLDELCVALAIDAACRVEVRKFSLALDDHIGRNANLVDVVRGGRRQRRILLLAMIIRLLLRTRDRERKLIKKIEEAIEKVENDDYGYCDVCGIEIGIRRLEARPTATLCIDCKTLDEIKERQTGG